jgi:tRNA(Phe) wybutosine-synthesizing methylase Tyw3
MGLVLSPEIMDKLVSALIEHKQKILDKMEYRYAEILAERKSSIGKSIVSNTGDIAVYQKELDYAQSTGNTQKVEEYTTKIAQLQEAIKGQKEILANPYKKLYPVAP